MKQPGKVTIVESPHTSRVRPPTAKVNNALVNTKKPTRGNMNSFNEENGNKNRSYDFFKSFISFYLLMMNKLIYSI